MKHHMGIFFGKKRKTTTDLSQTDIASKLKVKPQFVSNWERGMSNPPLKYYKKLARMLHLHKFDIEEQAIKNVQAEIERWMK